MYYMTGGNKQAFAPFDYPSHLYHEELIFQTPYSQPFHPPQQPPYVPNQAPSFPAYKTQHPIMNAFLKQDGTFDFEKTFQTVHQISSTIQHVSPLVKQVGSFFKIGKL